MHARVEEKGTKELCLCYIDQKAEVWVLESSWITTTFWWICRWSFGFSLILKFFPPFHNTFSWSFPDLHNKNNKVPQRSHIQQDLVWRSFPGESIWRNAGGLFIDCPTRSFSVWQKKSPKIRVKINPSLCRFQSMRGVQRLLSASFIGQGKREKSERRQCFSARKERMGQKKSERRDFLGNQLTVVENDLGLISSRRESCQRGQSRGQRHQRTKYWKLFQQQMEPKISATKNWNSK